MILRRSFFALSLRGALGGAVLAADSSTIDRIFAGKVPGETASFLVVLRQQADLSEMSR